MGDAYTPGLTVTAETVVRKTRRLPLRGQLTARLGDRVGAADVVARTELPGKVQLLNLANPIGVLPGEVEGKLMVPVGGAIQRGQVLAQHVTLFGLMKHRVESTVTGTLESVSSVTGQAVLREPPVPVEVTAYLDGEVVEEIEGEGVVIESRAALVQGIFGLGGEVNAPLVVVASRPDALLDAGDLTAEHAGMIIIGGAGISLAGMRRAIELGVAGVVVGGFAYQDIKELLGYDVGVAVTGNEAFGTTLVVTEGFGHIAMARATYELFARFAGQRASLSGATQIRAGVIRPEVVVPHGGVRAGVVASGGGLEVGAPVRCIRAPYFGRIGTVAALPVELYRMPSETKVRVLEVDLGGERVVVPRANVEVIER
jgi:hypothetical protein